ncbi:MAG: thiamine phosphate synthase [Marinifilaceae bacterium]|jgi:thiamine-phosphate pyrophosphorylase|nr:thiamine phosphate synthase [Marinifilaceae bacterium]
MEIRIISFPQYFSNEGIIINNILANYPIKLHLRKPQSSRDEYMKFIHSINEKYWEKLVIHNYHEDFNNITSLKNFHFNTYSRNKANKFEGAIKSTSCHSFTEILSCQSDFNTMFISPIFDSISKIDYKSNFESKEIVEFIDKNPLSKIVALGGITAENMKLVQLWGFKAIAVLGYIWNIETIKNTNLIFERIDKLFEV